MKEHARKRIPVSLEPAVVVEEDEPKAAVIAKQLSQHGATFGKELVCRAQLHFDTGTTIGDSRGLLRTGIRNDDVIWLEYPAVDEGIGS